MNYANLYKLDPVTAKSLDMLFELPITFNIKFKKVVPKEARKIIKKVIEKIRPSIEKQLLLKISQHSII